MAAVFPDDFYKRRHALCDELDGLGENWQWLLRDALGEAILSVVGGTFKGLHGDGVNTFEMWDFSTPEPQNFLTAEEINAYLQEHELGSHQEEENF